MRSITQLLTEHYIVEFNRRFQVAAAEAGEPVDPYRLTQVGRALRELGIGMILAYSPQARGRSERNFGTWQGRLPQAALS